MLANSDSFNSLPALWNKAEILGVRPGDILRESFSALCPLRLERVPNGGTSGCEIHSFFIEAVLFQLHLATTPQESQKKFTFFATTHKPSTFSLSI